MRLSLALSLALSLGWGVVLFAGVSCNDDSGDYAGQPCDAPDECYPDVDPGALRGTPICLDRVEGGYCTHLCQSDADCCAVEGECRGDFPQVCAPFESTGMMMCFLSCEASDLDGYDPGAFCQEEVHPAFGCRSTGGGSNNRKVCTP